MPTVVVQSSAMRTRVVVGDGRPVIRRLDEAYALQRLEEVIRAVAEDALNPYLSDELPWHDDVLFQDDLGKAVRAIAETANGLLAERLADLLDSAPPQLAGRLASAPRWSDQA